MGRSSLAPATAAVLAAHFETAPFTSAEAAVVGVSPARLRAAVDAGHVVRDHQGVFRIAPAAADGAPAGDAAARAVAHRIPGSVLSHETAARWQALPVPLDRSGDGHLTVPGARPRTTGLVRIHGSGLPHGHTAAVRGMNVTTPARTAIDIARAATFAEGLICMDAVLRRLVASHVDDGTSLRMAVHDAPFVHQARGTIQAALDDMHGWPRSPRARRSLTWADPASESALESQSRGVLLEHGVPAPECGYPIEGADGRVYWVDMAWEEARVVGECDGLAKYTESAILQREKLRQEALEQAGWRVVRWTYADILRAPQRVVGRVMAALVAGGVPTADTVMAALVAG